MRKGALPVGYARVSTADDHDTAAQITGLRWHAHIYRTEHLTLMKKLIALTVVAIASQAVAIFAGEPMVSSKQVVAPPPPPPPEFFRPNEFDIGAFGTYATGVGSSDAGKLHAWGEAWISLIGFHGICRCQVPRDRTGYPGGWRFPNQTSYCCSRFRPVTVSGGGAMWRRASLWQTVCCGCRWMSSGPAFT